MKTHFIPTVLPPYYVSKMKINLNKRVYKNIQCKCIIQYDIKLYTNYMQCKYIIYNKILPNKIIASCI